MKLNSLDMAHKRDKKKEKSICTYMYAKKKKKRKSVKRGKKKINNQKTKEYRDSPQNIKVD